MLTLDLKGASEALDALMGLFIPWRRRYAERRAKLENAQRQAEILRLNAETQAVKAKAEREYSAQLMDKSRAELTMAQTRKTDAETVLILAQAERAATEVEKERLKIRQAEIEFAFRVVDKCATESSDWERMGYVLQLLPLLDNPISGRLGPNKAERRMAEYQVDQREGDR